jgi:hypothetical protein
MQTKKLAFIDFNKAHIWAVPEVDGKLILKNIIVYNVK